MPIVSILPNGGQSYMPAPCPTHSPARRGDAAGWSRDVARRNMDFLLSVESERLSGHGLALSLTLKDCPATPQDWQNLRCAFFKRLRRMGMTRAHWLTEWQRRGVPHMHAAIWFDSPQDPARIKAHWTDAAKGYRSGIYSQDVKRIHGAVGWFEYLAKHATRSVANYQRSPENIPSGWQGKTGRMWGHLGDWPTSDAKDVDVPCRVWHQYRRLMIRYQVGKARRQRDRSRARYLRSYRSRAPSDTSSAQALPRFWIPERDHWELLTSAMRTHGGQSFV